MQKCLHDLAALGYGLLPGIIPPEVVPGLREAVAMAVRAHTSIPMPQGYLGGLLRRDLSMAPHLVHREVGSLCTEFFGPHWRIWGITGSVNGPGVGRGGMHVDWPYSRSDQTCIRDSRGPAALLIGFWMLTDFTVENGATIVVPGSHLTSPAANQGGLGVPPPAQEHRLLGKAGDVGFLDARAWHAIGPNLSAEDRVVVIVRYAPWWLNLNPIRLGTRDRRLMVEARQAKDPYVSWLSHERFMQLPADLQVLVDCMVEPGSG